MLTEHDRLILKYFFEAFEYIVASYGFFKLTKDWFLKLPFLYQLCLVLFSLIVSIIMLTDYFQLMHLYADFMEKAISTRLMTNDQEYRALESYILSDIKFTPSGGSENDKEIKEKFEVYKNKVNHLIQCYNEPDPKRHKIEQEWSKLNFSRNDLRWAGQTSNLGYITGPDCSLYLFQPYYSLQSVAYTKSAPQKLNSNVDAEYQILAAYAADSFFSYLLDGLMIDGCDIVQTYFMSDMGTLLIRGKENNGEFKCYTQNDFPYRKYFPDRPYFWNSFTKKERHGAYDYVSMPYIDYGGYGVIRTYCFAMDLPGGRRGIIGIDCSLGKEVDEIRPKLEKLCRSDFCDLKISSDGKVNSEGQIKKTFEPIIEKIKRNDISPSSITQEIKLLGGDDSTNFIFSIPIRWTLDEREHTTTTEVVLINLDSRIVEKNSKEVLFGLVALTLCISGVVLIVSKYYITGKEMENLLDRFSLVMEDSKIQFARFNEKGEFISANKAWWTMLGYQSEEDIIFRNKSQNIKRKFQDLLPDISSIERYESIIQKTKLSQGTQPQFWKLKMKDSEETVEVRTHAEGVLIRRMLKSDQLQRFGIVIAIIKHPSLT